MTTNKEAGPVAAPDLPQLHTNSRYKEKHSGSGVSRANITPKMPQMRFACTQVSMPPCPVHAACCMLCYALFMPPFNVENESNFAFMLKFLQKPGYYSSIFTEESQYFKVFIQNPNCVHSLFSSSVLIFNTVLFFKL